MQPREKPSSSYPHAPEIVEKILGNACDRFPYNNALKNFFGNDVGISVFRQALKHGYILEEIVVLLARIFSEGGTNYTFVYAGVDLKMDEFNLTSINDWRNFFQNHLRLRIIKDYYDGSVWRDTPDSDRHGDERKQSETGANESNSGQIKELTEEISRLLHQCQQADQERLSLQERIDGLLAQSRMHRDQIRALNNDNLKLRQENQELKQENQKHENGRADLQPPLH